MKPLFEVLQARVGAWRERSYVHDAFPAISEILTWAAATEDGGSLRFLRRPQVRALETYWHLRLVEDTPHIFELYKKLYQMIFTASDAVPFDLTKAVRGFVEAGGGTPYAS